MVMKNEEVKFFFEYVIINVELILAYSLIQAITLGKKVLDGSKQD